jgi:hypothetical protein
MAQVTPDRSIPAPMSILNGSRRQAAPAALGGKPREAARIGQKDCVRCGLPSAGAVE